jgi:nicotinamide riboside kinase
MAEAPRSVVVAILGAESTGKTDLAAALAPRIAADTGLSTTWVPELLREWCDAKGRTPRRDEQMDIARGQQARIDDAARGFDVVLCDTTALMTAVYSRYVFGDTSIDAYALAEHRRCAHTLLTALDLPWQPDGLQRDGPHAREPVDALARELLIAHALPWSLVQGNGEVRVASALDALTPLLRRHARIGAGLFSRLAARDAAAPRWDWVCDQCDVPECEHLLARSTGPRRD